MMTDAAPDLLGGPSSSSSSSSQSPGPTMASLPPPPGGASDNIAAALSSAPTTKPTPTPTAADAPSSSSGSGSSSRWGVMGGMAGSFVNSARNAAASVTNKPQQPGDATTTTAATSTNNDKEGGGDNDKVNSLPSGNAFFSSLTSNITSSVHQLNANVNLQPLSNMTKSISQSISHTVTGKNTLPDKTTASQVLMFRQLLHTKCRPGLRLSRNYEGTPAQMAVLHMPWWERGIEVSKKMIISYDNLITRLWLSGAIMPFEKGGYASVEALMNPDADGDGKPIIGAEGSIDTLINERGLPPVPHEYWVGRLGFQQDDPVTDFRSGGVLSLAMLVHIAESCPAVHSRFVPKPKIEQNGDAITMTMNHDISNNNNPNNESILTLEEILTDDASVLPFGITCINITDMLAKFLLFSKAVDKMDALLSAKPFWKMFIDPNAMLVLQEVSLDLLCDVCVEIGRERRVKKLVEVAAAANGEEEDGQKESGGGGMPVIQDGKVTVFDFSEIMERTEKRVRDEVLGPGPQNVDELRAIARRVKSKYLMRIQLKEKHAVTATSATSNNTNPASPLSKQIPPLPSKESMKNVTSSVIGGVGGFVNMLKKNPASKGATSAGAAEDESSSDVIDFSTPSKNDATDNDDVIQQQEVEVNLDGTTNATADSFGFDIGSPSPNSPQNPFFASSSASSPTNNDVTNNTAATSDAPVDEDCELAKLSAELGDLTSDFDLLGDDFNFDDIDHSEELLDAMDAKIDPMAAFGIDDEDLLS